MASYRDTFQREDVVSEYESRFEAGTYGSVLSSIEYAFLDRIMAEIPALHAAAYLDFACGSGRIISHVESHVGRSTGIDIAAPMLAVAREKVGRSTLICKDITSDDGAPEGSYDLITTFRFFLNAEPSLRLKVMRGLAARLKDEDSLLVFSVQGILDSHKIFSWVGRRIRSMVTGKPIGMGILSTRGVYQLARDSGLEIVETYGYDVLSGKARYVMGLERLARAERKMAGGALARHVGGHKIFVARLSR